MVYIYTLSVLFPLFLIIGLCDFDHDYDSNSDTKSLRNELDKLTRLLCEAGKVHLFNNRPSTELLNWWNDHYQKDKLKGR